MLEELLDSIVLYGNCMDLKIADFGGRECAVMKGKKKINKSMCSLFLFCKQQKQKEKGLRKCKITDMKLSHFNFNRNVKGVETSQLPGTLFHRNSCPLTIMIKTAITTSNSSLSIQVLNTYWLQLFCPLECQAPLS